MLANLVYPRQHVQWLAETSHPAEGQLQGAVIVHALCCFVINKSLPIYNTTTSINMLQ